MNRKKYIFEVVACVVNKFLYQFLMLIWAGSKLVWISFKNSTNTFKDLIFFWQLIMLCRTHTNQATTQNKGTQSLMWLSL